MIANSDTTSALASVAPELAAAVELVERNTHDCHLTSCCNFCVAPQLAAAVRALGDLFPLLDNYENARRGWEATGGTRRGGLGSPSAANDVGNAAELLRDAWQKARTELAKTAQRLR